MYHPPFFNRTIMECLNEIVGITRTQSACFTGDFNAAASRSNSGLYIDEVEGFLNLSVFKGVAAGEQKSIQDLLTDARADGIKQFKEVLYSQLGVRYSVKSASYNDYAGQVSGIGTVNPTFPLAATVLEMKQYSGASVLIEGVLPQFNFTGTLDVTVYRGINNGSRYQIINTVKSFTINTDAAQPAFQALTGLELAATDETGKAYSYLFVYQLSNGQAPKDNLSSCGCGGKENNMKQYFTVFGVSGPSVNEMNISERKNLLYGLLFKVKARCTGGDFLCQNYYDNEFIREAVNWAILRKSAATAMTRILTSPLINRYTMVNRETIATTINILNSKFNKSVTWIAENLDMSNNDCFTCHPGSDGAFQITKDSIYL